MKKSQGYLEASTGTFIGTVLGAYFGCFLLTLINPAFDDDMVQAISASVALLGGSWIGSVLGCWAALKLARCHYARRTAFRVAEFMGLCLLLILLWLAPKTDVYPQIGWYVGLIISFVGVIARYSALKYQQTFTLKSLSTARSLRVL